MRTNYSQQHNCICTGGGCAPQNCHHVAAAKAPGVTLGSTEVATVLLGANKRMVNETPSRHAHHTNGDCL